MGGGVHCINVAMPPAKYNLSQKGRGRHYRAKWAGRVTQPQGGNGNWNELRKACIDGNGTHVGGGELRRKDIRSTVQPPGSKNEVEGWEKGKGVASNTTDERGDDVGVRKKKTRSNAVIKGETKKVKRINTGEWWECETKDRQVNCVN